MATTIRRVELALRREHLRGEVDAIDRTRDGEVVVWINAAGRPVQSVREALRLASDARAERA